MRDSGRRAPELVVRTARRSGRIALRSAVAGLVGGVAVSGCRDAPPPSAIAAEPPPRTAFRFAAASEFRPALVQVPAGSFTMGSPDGVGNSAEHPAHQVTLPAFLICETEVTQAQHRAVVGATRRFCLPETHPCGDDYPANYVSWGDAGLYLNRLTALENEVRGPGQPSLTPCYIATGEAWHWVDGCTGYRLPTEAEWEYAARAGTTTAHSFGPGESLADHAWFGEGIKGAIHPVGRKRPNPWGLYDVHGNADEWCWDWYDDYQHVHSYMPTGPATGARRVIRGGFVNQPADEVRSATRKTQAPTHRIPSVGFRCARSLPGADAASAADTASATP